MKRLVVGLVLLSLLLPLSFGCGPRTVKEIVRELAPTQDAAQTGGSGLGFTFDDGVLSIKGSFMDIPSVAASGPVSTAIDFTFPEKQNKWIGVSIPVPASRVRNRGKVSLTVTGDSAKDAHYAETEYTANDPLQYYLAAKAPRREVSLQLVWDNAYIETLTIIYEDATERLADSLFVHAGRDFTGTRDETELVGMGDGSLALAVKAGSTAGNYTSEIIHTQPFEYLILSWNAQTPEGTHVELEGRALRSDGALTEWLSWGKWGSHRENANERSTKLYSRMIDDIYSIMGGKGEVGVGFQYRAYLVGSFVDGTPTLSLVAGTMLNTLPGQTISRDYDSARVDKGQSVDLAVPQYSQYIRDPQFASAICSPTSLAMVMEYHGLDLLVEEVVKVTYDSKLGSEGGYGNWSFNTAAAGSYGFIAYVDYLGFTDEDSLNLVRLELARGNPIIASVRYKNDRSVASNWPLLEGAPISSTSGHLVVIRGVMQRDGVTYLIVNDSAAAGDDEVRREYRADQFLQAWDQRVAYIVRPSSAEPLVPEYRAATFVRTGNTRRVVGSSQTEFVLVGANGNHVSLSNNIRNRYISIIYRKDNGPVNYFTPGRGDFIWIDDATIRERYEFTILFTDGRLYKATLH